MGASVWALIAYNNYTNNIDFNNLETNRYKKEKMNYTKFIKNLEIIRVARKLTKKELAEKCEINICYIEDIEAGERKPTLDELITICNKLNVSIDNMINGNLHISYEWCFN